MRWRSIQESEVRSQEAPGLIPFGGFEQLLNRRFEEAIDTFLAAQAKDGPSDGLCSALANAYHRLAFQTLAASFSGPLAHLVNLSSVMNTAKAELNRVEDALRGVLREALKITAPDLLRLGIIDEIVPERRVRRAFDGAARVIELEHHFVPA